MTKELFRNYGGVLLFYLAIVFVALLLCLKPSNIVSSDVNTNSTTMAYNTNN